MPGATQIHREVNVGQRGIAKSLFLQSLLQWKRFRLVQQWDAGARLCLFGLLATLALSGEINKNCSKQCNKKNFKKSRYLPANKLIMDIYIYVCGIYILLLYITVYDIWIYMEHPLISLVIHSWSFPFEKGFLDYQRWPEIQVAGIRPMISSRRSRPFLDSMTLTCGHGPWALEMRRYYLLLLLSLLSITKLLY